MDEKTYWVALEFRVCREFAELPEKRHRFWWCDGLLPKQYLLDDQSPRITGTAWICNGPVEDEWEFSLFLDKPVSTREEINWSAILPPENVTCWLAFDEAMKQIQFEPTAAVPDLP